jgi:hypothetical protein
MTHSRPDYGSISRRQDDNESYQFGIGIVVAVIALVFLIPLMMMEPTTNTTAMTHQSNRVLRPAYRPNPIFCKPYRPYPKH